jgi:hypothetical protein
MTSRSATAKMAQTDPLAAANVSYAPPSMFALT